jgi:hypothetical protein
VPTGLTFRQLAVPARLWMLCIAVLATTLPAVALSELSLSDPVESESESPFEESETVEEEATLHSERRQISRRSAGRPSGRALDRTAQVRVAAQVAPSAASGHRLANGLCAPIRC